ncbi:hypothetical protein V5O48_018011 [Marasmius crinis-equi]|uniref:Uncharacterized protein n=1 Tax=Marasmius crinis-equi TaxID=585013 RepID=A0ABR3EMI3_9AGAR
MRRKRLAKLSRTFGENVPPELVPAAHAGFDGDESRRHSEECSSRDSKRYSGSIHEAVIDIRIQPESPSISSINSLSSSSDSPPPPYTMLSPGAAARRASSLSVASSRSWVKQNHTKAESISHLSRDKRKDSDIELAFVQLTDHMEPCRQKQQLSVEQTYRRQKGWSGEWNRDDMDQVVKKLRMLK